MFFAETLGPVFSDLTARNFADFLRRRLGARKTISPDQLRELVSEFMYLANIRTTSDSVIDFMARSGVVTFQGPTAASAASFEFSASAA